MRKKVCINCSSGEFPLCADCRKNPFTIEDARKKLAEKKELKVLRLLYNSSFNLEKNKNTVSFWNKKLERVTTLSLQDGITKDRIKKAYSFIPKHAKRILDVGAGYGFVEELLQKSDSEIFGIDISSQGISLLNQRFRGEYKKGSISNIPYPDNFFDVVLGLEIVEHILPSEIFSAFLEVKRVLKKRGVLILSIPVNEGLRNKKNNPSRHVRDYSLALIKSELAIAGFKTINHEYFYAFSKWYGLKKQLQKFLLQDRWKPNDIVLRAVKL